jgi:hypothetical protein
MHISADPARHSQPAKGDFYVNSDCCLACGVPQAIAPELVGSTEGEYWHCYWKRQPQNADEVAKALRILRTQEMFCHRYAGRDPAILAQLEPECCDHPLSPPSSPESVFGRDPTKASHPRFVLIGNQQGRFARLWKTLTRRGR